MIVSRRMAVIPKDIHEVWKIVTSVEAAGWRFKPYGDFK